SARLLSIPAASRQHGRHARGGAGTLARFAMRRPARRGVRGRELRPAVSLGGRAIARRVLLMSPAWPPQCDPGSIRLLKFAQYLPEFGWEAVVVTAGDRLVERPDEQLMRAVPSSVRVLFAGQPTPWPVDLLYPDHFVGWTKDATRVGIEA